MRETWAKYFFKKSKNQKGFIYCCKRTLNICSSTTGEQWQEVQWKFGKTKNIETRMRMYGENYELLAYYPVDHLSLRENLIRRDHRIEDDRRFKDSRDEHVDFNISDIVEDYATAEIKWGKTCYRTGHQFFDLFTKDGDDGFCENTLMAGLHF
jgi:hypothetical protein